MDSRPIGVFDSGLGGLTCVAELMKVLPDEDIVYFGDTARVPYGTRSRNTIIEYAQQDAAFIRNKGVKLMIAACGTVSSALGDVDISGGLPFTGVVEPAAVEAVNAAENGIIGVIGTAATIASGAYEASIKRISPDIKVYSQACPLFVPLVENGFTDKNDIVVKEIVRRYLEPIKASGADVLIMGCTHYPHLADAIADMLGDVKLISSGAAAARYAKRLIIEGSMQSGRDGHGKISCYTSDSAEKFRENAALFFGNGFDGTVDRITIEELVKT